MNVPVSLGPHRYICVYFTIRPNVNFELSIQFVEWNFIGPTLSPKLAIGSGNQMILKSNLWTFCEKNSICCIDFGNNFSFFRLSFIVMCVLSVFYPCKSLYFCASVTTRTFIFEQNPSIKLESWKDKRVPKKRANVKQITRKIDKRTWIKHSNHSQFTSRFFF